MVVCSAGVGARAVSRDEVADATSNAGLRSTLGAKPSCSSAWIRVDGELSMARCEIESSEEFAGSDQRAHQLVLLMLSWACLFGDRR